MFLSSVHACTDLIKSLSNHSIPRLYVSSAFKVFCSISGHSPINSFEDFNLVITQKSVSRAIDSLLYDKLLSSATGPCFCALSLSSSIPHAGDWLLALLSPSLGLHFLDLDFKTCQMYWLGIPLFRSDIVCPLCTRACDPLGDHSVACGGNGDKILRHNSHRNVLFTAAQAAALSPRRETSSIVPRSCSHPADLYLPNKANQQL
uniref:Uncharacterized protein n=1 Tax=Amphimedon queenslandica TaxID=400682 RepID=A0A1X7SKN1_AMPQE